MAFRGLDINQFILFLIFGTVFVAIISSVINFAAINDPDADLIKNIDDTTAPEWAKWIIIGMAMWLVWTFIIGTGGRWDKKKFASFALTVVVLYFAYTVLQALLPNTLPDLTFAAYNLQTMVLP